MAFASAVPNDFCLALCSLPPACSFSSGTMVESATRISLQQLMSIILPSPILPTLPFAFFFRAALSSMSLGGPSKLALLSPSRYQVSLPVRKSQSPDNRFRRSVMVCLYPRSMVWLIYLSPFLKLLSPWVRCCAAVHILLP